MQRSPINSSSINSVGYDPKTQTMDVEFNTGKVYRHFNVPQNVHNGLIGAESHGKHYHKNVKTKFKSTTI